MAFIELGGEYYNELVLAKAFTKDIEDADGIEQTHYYVQTLGGQNIEITQEEYNDIIGA